LTIEPFPSQSHFTGDAAAMGSKYVQELEEHLHQRDARIQELKDTIVALEDSYRVKIAELKSIMVANQERIADLERRLTLDSTNSSKLPSHDGWRKPL